MRDWGWSTSVQDRIVAVLVWIAALTLLVGCAVILGDVVRHGLPVVDLEFLTSRPLNSGRAGGILPIAVNTVLVLCVCLGVAVPLGLGTACFLVSIAPRGSRSARWSGRSLDVLAGVPSIVFGLFGNTLFCQVLGMGFSILAGGLTLSCMVLPLFIRTTEAGLRAVPEDISWGATALGLSRSTTLLKLALPAAAPAILAGLVLSVGRALAETAALIFTSGYVDRMPSSLMDSGRTLSIHIYDLSMNVAGGTQNAWGSAMILLGLLVLINAIAGWMSRRWIRRGYSET